ncbi:MAG: hypothetical protein GPOALKHO_000923 [Sodalis sp.]|nr:MAG: hypothetical protein GPOALKHO_000923 [Sodalis sp.]
MCLDFNVVRLESYHSNRIETLLRTTAIHEATCRLTRLTYCLLPATWKTSDTLQYLPSHLTCCLHKADSPMERIRQLRGMRWSPCEKRDCATPYWFWPQNGVTMRHGKPISLSGMLNHPGFMPVKPLRVLQDE